MKLAIRIQTVPERSRWCYWLRRMLNAEPHGNKIIEAVEDTENNLWNNAKRTLQSFGKFDSHMMVLQDDILPCKDLIKTAEKLTQILPDEPITLFSNRENIMEAKRLGLHWVKIRKWLMAQAYIMPIPIIKDFLSWEEHHVKQDIYFDDNRWAMYFFYHDRPVWATAPSLVEHIGWNETALTGYNPGHQFEPRLRMAKWFLGFQNSGLDIDWENLDAVGDLDGNNADFCHYLV